MRISAWHTSCVGHTSGVGHTSDIGHTSGDGHMSRIRHERCWTHERRWTRAALDTLLVAESYLKFLFEWIFLSHIHEGKLGSYLSNQNGTNSHTRLTPLLPVFPQGPLYTSCSSSSPYTMTFTGDWITPRRNKKNLI